MTEGRIKQRTRRKEDNRKEKLRERNDKGRKEQCKIMQ